MPQTSFRSDFTKKEKLTFALPTDLIPTVQAISTFASLTFLDLYGRRHGDEFSVAAEAAFGPSKHVYDVIARVDHRTRNSQICHFDFVSIDCTIACPGSYVSIGQPNARDRPADSTERLTLPMDQHHHR